ncbi:hypothetical protein [Corynebacterium sp. UMB10321]|uniref:hypothetical protein n=1 Tax=Corynebacterium sp. UMB10321 TaxID=3046312 RepID=UPI00254E95BA|nr:hypothetical protein [Corynebacterium sp. UMB10321]MDK8244056.1 hypothetical protein [Corynebacterium sp. UMB10321]
MNLTTARLALRGISGAWNYFRELNSKQQRDVYEALTEAIKDDNIDDLHDLADVPQLEGIYDAARQQAGKVTRASHARIDARRALHAATAPDRKARQIALKKEARKRGTGSKVLFASLGACALAAGGWALWEFYLREKLEERNHEPKHALREDATEGTSEGTATLVYSTDSADDQFSTLDALDEDQRRATK